MRSSYYIAGAIALTAGAWLASPYFDLADLGLGEASGTQSAEMAIEDAAPAVPERRLATVRVQTMEAQPVTREIVADGYTEPDRVVELKGEVNGTVEEVIVNKGSKVDKGQLIVRLERRDRQASVKHFEALVSQRNIEREAARKLGEKGFQAETRVAEMEALYEQATADLEYARIQLEHTDVNAPFTGLLDDRYVEVGDFVDIGDLVARVIDNDPLVVVADIPETVAGLVRPGMTGNVRLVSGLTFEAEVAYVAAQASEATRTFRVELEAANAEGLYPAGVSATITLELEEVPAHKVSSGLLVLDDRGILGIKAVDGDDVVHFHQAQIIRSEADSVWLKDLPETLRIITVGQGFVTEGQKVEVIDASASAPLAQASESAPS
ncbi:MAG: efflux RND transporter periplasmic adaptor subunit [Pseudomonadota bacterium]